MCDMIAEAGSPDILKYRGCMSWNLIGGFGIYFDKRCHWIIMPK